MHGIFRENFTLTPFYKILFNISVSSVTGNLKRTFLFPKFITQKRNLVTHISLYTGRQMLS